MFYCRFCLGEVVVDRLCSCRYTPMLASLGYVYGRVSVDGRTAVVLKAACGSVYCDALVPDRRSVFVYLCVPSAC